jgi:hypothetical protein
LCLRGSALNAVQVQFAINICCTLLLYSPYISGSIRHIYLFYTLTLFAIYIRFNSPYISVLHSYFIRHIYLFYTLTLFAIYICFTLLLYSPYISGSIRHIYLFHSYIPQCSLLYFKTHHKCQTCVLTRNMS